MLLNLQGSTNISNYQLNLSSVFVCVCLCVPHCFIASAMSSHVLMGFSNLTIGLEIMKGDKEH